MSALPVHPPPPHPKLSRLAVVVHAARVVLFYARFLQAVAACSTLDQGEWGPTVRTDMTSWMVLFFAKPGPQDKPVSLIPCGPPSRHMLVSK